jgi:hypothetical protein
MARVVDSDRVSRSARKSWLEIAEEIKRETGPVEVYRHTRAPDASAEALHRLAGIIRVNGPIPAWDVFDEAPGGE